MRAVSMVDPLVDLTRKSIGETGAQVLAKDIVSITSLDRVLAARVISRNAYAAGWDFLGIPR
jgi:hypothetical protein